MLRIYPKYIKICFTSVSILSEHNVRPQKPDMSMRSSKQGLAAYKSYKNYRLFYDGYVESLLDNKLLHEYTANSIKVVLPEALTVNYERARDDGLLLIFTPKLGIMSTKHLNSLR